MRRSDLNRLSGANLALLSAFLHDYEGGRYSPGTIWRGLRRITVQGVRRTTSG